MGTTETPLVITGPIGSLIGLLHAPPDPRDCGILILVGGPQYRAGSHRQYVSLARAWSARGIPVMRFDHAGAGDSDGLPEQDGPQGADIRSVLDVFFEQVPQMDRVILFGLCDAATAAADYAPLDDRVAGVILVNPWVRSEAGLARAYLKEYYLSRMFDREFWSKVVRGEFNMVDSFKSLVTNVAKACGRKGMDLSPNGSSDAPANVTAGEPRRSLATRMRRSLETFDGRVLFILSGNDLVAAEFRDAVRRSRRWRRLLNESRVSRADLPEANHTFSRREWRDEVVDWVVQWSNREGTGAKSRGSDCYGGLVDWWQ